MDSQFLESFFAAPPVLLGRGLKPFCCGHAATLAVLNSPFIESGDLTPEEIIVAVWVCSQTFEEGQKKLIAGPSTVVEECETWGQSVGAWDVRETNRIFQEYLAQHTKAPETWKSKNSKTSKAPWPLTVVTTLMLDLKIPESESWNMPLQKALWYFASIAERNGAELVSEQDRERLRLAREGRKA